DPAMNALRPMTQRPEVVPFISPSSLPVFRRACNSAANCTERSSESQAREHEEADLERPRTGLGVDAQRLHELVRSGRCAGKTIFQLVVAVKVEVRQIHRTVLQNNSRQPRKRQVLDLGPIWGKHKPAWRVH